MKHLTLGVLGHVDHGKTSLVRALSGVDTDRLKEEKERGISIVLGFADLALPSGRISFVDVPGHERFVRTMISGATGIGAVLLAVAANEGVMPQTIEHLDIAALLGIERGVVALTQCDRVTPAERETVIAQTRQFLASTVLARAPLVPTSAVTSEGLAELRAELDSLAAETPEVLDEGYAYLPVDRVFSMTGAGTIVTGTLRRGALDDGATLEVYPDGARAAVRGLQVHGESVSRALPGQRVAVNLRNVAKESLARGDALASPGSLRRGRFLDVELTLLASTEKPLRHGQPLRVLFGTSELFGRAHLLDRAELAPGARACCQLHLDSDAAFLRGERFVIRAYSPMRTLGGGSLLGATTSRRKRNIGTAELETLAHGPPEDVLALRCRETAPAPIDTVNFAMLDRYSPERVDAAAKSPQFVRVGERGLLPAATLDRMRGELRKLLDTPVHSGPIAAGLSPDEILSRLGKEGNRETLNALLQRDTAGALLVELRGRYRLAAALPTPGDDKDRPVRESIESTFRAAGLEPPPLTQVVGEDKVRARIYRQLVDSGVLFVAYVPYKPRIPANALVFHSDTIQSALAKLKARVGAESIFDTAQAKVALGISRKFLIPLLELFDTLRFTRRRGEAREFVNPPAPPSI